MNQSSLDVNKLTWFEIEMLRALRRTAPEKHGQVVEVVKIFADNFPKSPALRLVQSNS